MIKRGRKDKIINKHQNFLPIQRMVQIETPSLPTKDGIKSI